MARSLAQLTDAQVGSVAWVADDERPLVDPPSGAWFELEPFDDPTTGDIFSAVCPIRFAPAFDTERYNVVQTDPSLPGESWWLYNTQGQAVSFDDGTGPWHWLNTLPSGTPNVFPPPTNWRKYEADGEGRAVWQQPSGAFDSYPEGFGPVVHVGRLWMSLIPANTTTPGSDPRWWEDVGPA